MACSNFQLPKIKYGYQIKKKRLVLKTNVQFPNTDLFSFLMPGHNCFYWTILLRPSEIFGRIPNPPMYL